MSELSEPKLLTFEQCLKYKSRLSKFYYSNMQLCSFMGGFSYEDAVAKIENMIEHVANGTAMVFGVFDQEDLISFLWAYEHQYREESRVYVSEIHVDEPYRHRGIGKRLLSAIESLAKKRDYRALYIHAEGNNDDVIRLYHNEGYVTERVQLRKQL